jgi:hypothetical protein
MKKGLMILLSFIPLWMSSPAWALFNAQVLTGKRTTDFKASGAKAQSLEGDELKAAFHLDPIPLVPVGFGLSLSQLTWEKVSDLTYGLYPFKKIEGTEISMEVEAWLPVPGLGLVPYGKIGYTLGGAYTGSLESSTNGTLALKPAGTYVALGLKYEFLMRLGVMVEYEKASRKLSFDALKDLADVSTQVNLDANSSSFLLGVQAGL